MTATTAAPGGRAHAPGRIGPNALTQLLPLIERAGGVELRERLLSRAGVVALPDMTGLIDEAPVARLHQAMRAELPEIAPQLAWEAGIRTADYILAHRIPRAVQAVLRRAPAWVAGPVLSRAIAKNAWTFAGSGRFEVVRTWPAVFLIHDNPVVRGEAGPGPLCHWHRGVFERLFRALVTDRAQVRETECCACGAEACRFEVGTGG